MRTVGDNHDGSMLVRREKLAIVRSVSQPALQSKAALCFSGAGFVEDVRVRTSTGAAVLCGFQIEDVSAGVMRACN